MCGIGGRGCPDMRKPPPPRDGGPESPYPSPNGGFGPSPRLAREAFIPHRPLSQYVPTSVFTYLPELVLLQ